MCGRSDLALAWVLSCACGCASTSTPAPSEQDVETAINACLDANPPDDPRDQLWGPLSNWAFANSESIPGRGEPADPAQIDALLDQAAAEVGIDSEAEWASAGRYFQAENFHALERRACQRSLD